MEEEVSSGSISIDEVTIEIDHDKEQTRDVQNQIDEPKQGMEFDSLDELFAFYAGYARDKGFAVSKRTSTKMQGVVRYVEFQCTRGGTTKSRSTNPLNVRPTAKIDCKAKLRAFHCPNGRWSVKSVELSHNHEMSPGVNHHGQSVLLGCGLISSEDTETFTWLFKSWLTCMSDCPPNAIITDQDRAMKKAIEVVFPNARHRWCLWHIMKKLPEKLKGYTEYESIKFMLQNAVYDSLTIEEFEDAWGKFIENYKLESNEWLLGLYDERHRWVPAFVKDIFWAGMSTTQRSESMHAFFDGYINSKTTLKQFVEQYENALAKKVENEKHEEFSSYNSCYPCATPLGMEKQFQSVYTRLKFKEFQNELFGKLCCHLILIKVDDGFREYEVRERVRFGDGHRSATFKLVFNDNTKEVNCNCRLFEFRGIMCRHQLMVYNDMEIYDEVPARYILQRWSKNIKRRHTKIRISYDNWSERPEARRFDKMCNIFYELGEVAADSDTWCDEVIAQIQQMKEGYKEKAAICGSNMPILTNHSSQSTSHGDGIVLTKESTNILDPFVTRSKGRPPSKRRVGNVEKAVKKKAKAKKKTNTSTSARGIDEHNNEHVTQEIRMGVESSVAFQPPNVGIEETLAFQPQNLGIEGSLAFQPPNLGMGGSLDYYDFI